MTALETRCQCPRGPAPGCGRPMTQEDLLCNACRYGCSVLEVDGQPPQHMVVTLVATGAEADALWARAVSATSKPAQ